MNGGVAVGTLSVTPGLLDVILGPVVVILGPAVVILGLDPRIGRAATELVESRPRIGPLFSRSSGQARG